MYVVKTQIQLAGWFSLRSQRLCAFAVNFTAETLSREVSQKIK